MINRLATLFLFALSAATLTGCASNPGGTVSDYEALHNYVSKEITISGKATNSPFGLVLNAPGLTAFSTQYWPDDKLPKKPVHATGVLQSSLSIDHPYVLTHVTWSGTEAKGLPTLLYITWPGGGH